MRQVTTSTFTVDDEGLAALQAPREDLALETDEGAGRYGLAEGPFDHYERILEVTEIPVETAAPGAGEPGALRHRVTETTTWELAIPIWSRLFRRMVGRMVSRRGVAPTPLRPDEEAPAPPWWSPPARLDARSAQVLSRLCGLALLSGYLGTIITQTLTFAGDEFGASTTARGATLAAVRIGVLFSLGLLVLADRRGRQKLLVLCAVGGTLAAAAGAAAPNLVALGATQTISRAFSTAMGLLIAVVAAEEMPAGGRAYAVSVLAMTGGLGAGLAVMFLPLAGLAEPAWRIIYVIPLLVLPFFLRVGRALPESRRFTRHHDVTATLAGHRGRLVLLASAAFFSLLFFAPNTQFQNDFLRNEHGFSALQLTLFTLGTNTPGGIGIVVGGRLADTRGRRLVGSVGTVGGVILLAAAYQVGGPWLWLFSLTGTIVAAVTVPALAVYGPELFPTSLRGRANGVISVAGVSGSAVGLIAGGRMQEHYGRFGPGLAILGVGPLIVAVLVLLFYPETAHRELEELNPEDAAASAQPASGGPIVAP